LSSIAVKAFRFTLGEAMVTIGFLALLFSAVAMAPGLWLSLGIVALMILLPSYLVSLLMRRRYFGANSKNGRDWPGEL
jgi:membrane protein implicated in regulation of membrane protease activity